MKGLFIIIGESFRTGSQNTRTKGLPESFKGQQNACMSHIELFKYFKHKCHVLIDSYTTQYNDNLLEWYHDYAIGYKFHDHVLGYNNLYVDAITRWKHLFDDYDYIQFLRIDICLKKFFLEKWKFPTDKIMYSFICWKYMNKTYDGYPRVADMMVYVPKLFYDKLFYDKNIPRILDHDGWSRLIAHGIRYSDIDVLVYTYHDSDSEKDWNPLYYIVNRNQSNVWVSDGLFFDLQREEIK